jgi:hypothetical protein
MQDLYCPCVDLSSTTIKNIEKNDDILTRSMGKDGNEWRNTDMPRILPCSTDYLFIRQKRLGFLTNGSPSGKLQFKPFRDGQIVPPS